MDPNDQNILKALKTRRDGNRPVSALFEHLEFIKAAWEEFDLGVPSIIAGLQQRGAKKGVSLANVQGFITRSMRSGMLGSRGSRASDRCESTTSDLHEKEHGTSDCGKKAAFEKLTKRYGGNQA